ncbi:unnamed protein product [Boreogadus saida]
MSSDPPAKPQVRTPSLVTPRKTTTGAGPAAAAAAMRSSSSRLTKPQDKARASGEERLSTNRSPGSAAGPGYTPRRPGVSRFNIVKVAETHLRYTDHRSTCRALVQRGSRQPTGPGTTERGVDLPQDKWGDPKGQRDQEAGENRSQERPQETRRPGETKRQERPGGRRDPKKERPRGRRDQDILERPGGETKRRDQSDPQGRLSRLNTDDAREKGWPMISV